MPSSLQTQIGRYSLESRIGTGGMAELYLARHAGAGELERTCVVKRLLPELAQDPEMLDMFLDEARVGLLLDHPNVLSVHDVGRVDDGVFLAMELVKGHDLRWILSACSRAGLKVPTEIVLFIAGELLKALDHAHRALGPGGAPLQLVHRDVSPENVLISRAGAVKLADFGAAQSTLSRSRRTSGLVGKLAYISPEALERGVATPSGDLFAVGLMMAEMLAGAPLHTAATPRDAWQFWQRFEPTRDLPSSVPLAHGGAILIKALETDPGRRYESAEAFLEDVLELMFRRGRTVGSDATAEFLRSLEGSDEESGRIQTAPVDLPAAGSGECEEVTLSESEIQAHLHVAGESLGPLSLAVALREGAGLDEGDGLIYQPGLLWRRLGKEGHRPPEARLANIALGAALLRCAETEGTRVTLWLQHQLVSFVLAEGRVLRAVHINPEAGAAGALMWGGEVAEALISADVLLEAGQVDSAHLEVLHRKELRSYLELPMRWDDMWSVAVTTSMEGVALDTVEGAEQAVDLSMVIADAARSVRGERQIEDRVTRASQAGLALSGNPDRYANRRLWPLEHKVLAEIQRGMQMPELLKRHQVDTSALFRTLYVLFQTGIVETPSSTISG